MDIWLLGRLSLEGTFYRFALGLSVHQQYVAGLCHADQLHDALSVRMSTEGHVLHLQFHLQLGSRERKSFLTYKYHLKTKSHLGMLRVIFMELDFIDKEQQTKPNNVKRMKKHNINMMQNATTAYRSSSFQLQFSLAIQDLVTNSSLDTITRHDDLNRGFKNVLYFL